MKDSQTTKETSLGWRWFRNLSIFGALLALYFAGAVFVAVLARKRQITKDPLIGQAIQIFYTPLIWSCDHNKTFAKTFVACVDFFCPEDGTTTK